MTTLCKQNATNYQFISLILIKAVNGKTNWVCLYSSHGAHSV